MTPNSEPSRANQIWTRFAGMFGADALERKFGKSPPPEWTAMLSRLNPFEVDRGLRRLAYSGKPHVPSLPEFTKLCRAVADDGVEEGPRPIALAAPAAGNFDGWAITSNNRFLKYITKRLTAHPRAWGVPGSAQQAEATQIAVAYKNAWAQDMREGDAVDTGSGEVMRLSREVQDSTWADAMKRAEADIVMFLAEKAA